MKNLLVKPINNPLFKKIIRGMGANSFAQLVTLFSQIIYVPLLISELGASVYGIWIVLSAIPTYINSVSAGYGVAAASKMTMTSGLEDNHHNNIIRTYHSVLGVTHLIFGSLVLILGIAVLFLEPDIMPFSEFTSGQSIILTTSLLTLSTVMSLYIGVFDAGFRASDRYATGIFIFNLMRAVEVIIFITCVLFFKLTIVELAAITAVARFITVSTMYVSLTVINRHFILGLKNFSWQEVSSLNKNALSNVILPLGYSFSIQGMIIITALVSPLYTATFAAIRTLLSVSRQAVLIYSNSIIPEISRSYGASNLETCRKLVRYGILVGILIAISYFTSIHMVGSFIMNTWTHGQLNWRTDISIPLALSIGLSILWNQYYYFLMAINKLWVFAKITMIIYLLSFLLSFVLISNFELNFIYIYAIADLTLLIISFLIYRRLVSVA